MFKLDRVHIIATLGIVVFLQGCAGTPLIEAIQRRDTSTALSLIKDKQGINEAAFSGYTPLHYAAEAADETLLSELIRAGADIEAKTSTGVTPLDFAISTRRPVTDESAYIAVKILIDAGARIDTIRTDGATTPLGMAAQQGFAKTLELLLSSGGEDMPLPNSRGIAPCALDAAADNGHVECVKLLLRGRCFEDLKAGKTHQRIAGFSALHAAALKGHFDVVKLLIESGAPINLDSYNGTPLTMAGLNLNVEIVNYLIELGAEIVSHEKYKGHGHISTDSGSGLMFSEAVARFSLGTQLARKGNRPSASAEFARAAPLFDKAASGYEDDSEFGVLEIIGTTLATAVVQGLVGNRMRARNPLFSESEKERRVRFREKSVFANLFASRSRSISICLDQHSKDAKQCLPEAAEDPSGEPLNKGVIQ